METGVETMNGWQERYDAARAEWQAANTLWIEADQAMARANARIRAAERELSSIFHERVRQVNGVIE